MKYVYQNFYVKLQNSTFSTFMSLYEYQTKKESYLPNLLECTDKKVFYKNLSFEVVSCPLRFHFMIYLAWPWFIYTLKVWLTIKKVIVYPMYTNKFQRYAKNIFFDIFCPKDFHSNTSLSKYFLNKLLFLDTFFTIRVSNEKSFDKENKLQWLVRPPFPWKSLS